MTGTTTSTTQSSPQPKPAPISRGVGNGAGLLAVALIVFSVVGGVWGAFRQPIRGTHLEEGAISLDPTSSAEFASFITFVLITGVLGALVGAFAYASVSRSRGVGMLLWAIVVALAGAASFLAVGDLVGTAVHSTVVDPEDLAPGQEVALMPGFNPQVGWLVSPFLAALAYWLCLVLGVRNDED